MYLLWLRIVLLPLLHCICSQLDYICSELDICICCVPKIYFYHYYTITIGFVVNSLDLSIHHTGKSPKGPIPYPILWGIQRYKNTEVKNEEIPKYRNIQSPVGD